MKVPQRIARRKTRLLKAELQALQKYKTEASLLLDEYKLEYARDMTFLEEKLIALKETHSPEQDDENTLTIDSEEYQQWKKTEEGWEKEESESLQEPEPAEKPETPEWAKKLYRKIALVSHPDRASDHFPRDKLKKIFIETTDAMSEGDFEKLLGFALELGIEEEQDDISMLPLLSKRVEDVKQEIKKIEKCPEWLWGEGLGIPEMRIGLAMIFFSKRGVDLNMEELAAIIQEMESASDQGLEQD